MVGRVVLALFAVLALGPLPGCGCVFLVGSELKAVYRRPSIQVGATDVRGWRRGERWVVDYTSDGRERRAVRGDLVSPGERRELEVVPGVADDDGLPTQVTLRDGDEVWSVDVSTTRGPGPSLLEVPLWCALVPALAVDVVTSPLQLVVYVVLLATGHGGRLPH